MDIGKDWQTGRRYMRMDYFEEENSEMDEVLVKEIESIKEEEMVNEELVAQLFYRKKETCPCFDGRNLKFKG